MTNRPLNRDYNHYTISRAYILNEESVKRRNARNRFELVLFSPRHNSMFDLDLHEPVRARILNRYSFPIWFNGRQCNVVDTTQWVKGALYFHTISKSACILPFTVRIELSQVSHD